MTGQSLRQVAYLSTQPDVLLETLGHVRHFMPWVTDVVVLTPRRTVAAFEGLGAGLTVLADEDVVEPGTDLRGMDHQSRNFALRVGLCRSGAVDEVFLSSDDDYRPLKAVHPDRFLRPGPGGREQLVGHAFYDLRDWTSDLTDFDRGQTNTLQVLAYLGAEQLAYASHMPQAVDRALFVEAAGMVRRVAPDLPVDEWAVHVNLGRLLDPERFAPAVPHVTLAWPEYPHVWRRSVVPHEYAFENFYPGLYEPGHLFAGLPTALDPARVEQDAVEKLLRWRRLDLAIRRLEVPAGVVVPWLRDTPARRAYLAALRRLSRTLDLVQLGERAERSRRPPPGSLD